MTDEEFMEMAANLRELKGVSQVLGNLADGSKEIEDNGVVIPPHRVPSSIKDRLEMAKGLTSKCHELHEWVENLPGKLREIQDREEAVTKTEKELKEERSSHNARVGAFGLMLKDKYWSY